MTACRVVLAATVSPNSNRPHYLIREGAENGVYVRVGSTNRRADAALIAELRRYALGQSFDEQPLPELDSEAIDFRAASESFAAVRPQLPATLAAHLAPPARAWWPSSSAAWLRKSALARATRNAAITW